MKTKKNHLVIMKMILSIEMRMKKMINKGVILTVVLICL